MREKLSEEATPEEPRYPKQSCIADVVFKDGVCKSFRITAGPRIAHYLMEQASGTGIVVLRDDDASTVACIPLSEVSLCTFRPE